MQTTNNGPNPFHHDSTQWGLIQLRLRREREEQERIEAAKSEIDRVHEDALRRFHARSITGEGSTQPNVSSADKEKINLAQQVDESKRVYWRIVDGKFEPITN
jgi:hypothetical protein